jgi:hypothetical protein
MGSSRVRPGAGGFESFEARSITETGRCPRDSGGRTQPYPEALATDETGPGLTAPCPVCGMLYPRRTFSRDRSTHPGPFSRWSMGSVSTAVRPPLRDFTSTRKMNLALDQAGLSGRAPAAPTPRIVRVQEARILRITTGERRSEPIGTQVTEYDNSGSSSSSVETLHISHTTEFVLQFLPEKATVSGGGAAIGLAGLANIQGSLQQTVRAHHSVAVKSTFTVERTSEIQVAPHKHVRVILSWKRYWQDGVVTLASQHDRDDLPYAMKVDLGFHNKTIDVA